MGGNKFIYYSSKQARNWDFKGPDFFVVLGVNNNPARQGWVVWEEGGRYPDVMVELLSSSTAEVDKGPFLRNYWWDFDLNKFPDQHFKVSSHSFVYFSVPEMLRKNL